MYKEGNNEYFKRLQRWLVEMLQKKQSLRLGFLRVTCDEVAIHVEEADPQQVEDDV